MRNKINKIRLLLKKDGLITTIKKVCKYIKAQYISKINVFSYIYVKLNSKKIKSDLQQILNENYDRIIVWRSSFGWNVPLFQRPQHIETQLSNKKCLIFYEVTTVTDKVRTYKKVKDNLYLVNFNNRAIKKLVLEEIDKINKPKYIQFYSTDATVSVNELKQYIENKYKVIYEYIDDISPLLIGAKELPANVKDKYEYMLKDTDNVFVVVTADEIEKDVLSKRKNEKIVFSCNGVDYKHFADLKDKYEIDDKFKKIVKEGKPIIGYYGALATWFDYDLIKELAKQRPEYNIVLLGIKYDGSYDKANLEECNNIYFLGSREYKVLPYYAKEFTVCTIPFLINSITNATSPVKLFEYMALDKPIVTTAMPECKKYASVMIANNRNEFIGLVDKAVKMNKNNNSDYYGVLKKEALENTWSEKANAIVELLKKYE